MQFLLFTSSLILYIIYIARRFYFQIRLYDPKRQRRPVISFEWEDSPLTCISAVPSTNG